MNLDNQKFSIIVERETAAPLLSIIVPVYNVEQYLQECVESLLAQTFSRTEIILVDDGSTDSGSQICDNLAKRDSRVIVVHQNNKGVSAARNAGLEIAKGKYISFVDGDDFVTAEFTKAMQRVASEDAELFIFGYSLVSESNEEIRRANWKSQMLTAEEAIHNVFDYENSCGLKPAVWNKIFLRKTIGKLRFDENLAISEDLKFFIEYLTKIKRVMLAEECYYCWRQRKSSVTHSGGRVSDIAKTVETDLELYDLLSNFCPAENTTFLRWMVQDNIGWYRVGKQNAKSDADRACLKKMKKLAMAHPLRVLTCKSINWKERVIYAFGKY